VRLFGALTYYFFEGTMFRYWFFRILSLLIGFGFIIQLITKPLVINFNSFLHFSMAVFFALYGLSPFINKQIFRIDPDEDVIRESKKDFKIMLNIFRKNK
jgi:hypothetical protein